MNSSFEVCARKILISNLCLDFSGKGSNKRSCRLFSSAGCCGCCCCCFGGKGASIPLAASFFRALSRLTSLAFRHLGFVGSGPELGFETLFRSVFGWHVSDGPVSHSMSDLTLSDLNLINIKDKIVLKSYFHLRDRVRE